MKEFKKQKILLVQGNYTDVDNIREALNKLKLDYTLYSAHNGTEALALLTGNTPGNEKINPDVILLDLNMPEMNGLEFLRVIKSYYSLKNIKIFILSTEEAYERLTAYNLDVDGFIVKPLDFSYCLIKGAPKLLLDILK